MDKIVEQLHMDPEMIHRSINQGFTHYVDETLGKDGLLKPLEREENRSLVLWKGSIVFKSVTKGKIVKEKSGKYGWNWDLIFISGGHDKTMANYLDNEGCFVGNIDAYQKLANYKITIRILNI